MKKYKIELSGQGAECYVFPLTHEQLVKLKNGGVVNDKMSIDDICQVLNIGDIMDTELIYTGPYDDSELIFIKVSSEDEDLVVVSIDNWNYQIVDNDDYINVHYKEKNLIVANDCKGEFLIFIIETEEDFDLLKLTPIITEIGELVTIITGLRYDDKILESADYGNYRCNGFRFQVT